MTGFLIVLLPHRNEGVFKSNDCLNNTLMQWKVKVSQRKRKAENAVVVVIENPNFNLPGNEKNRTILPKNPITDRC